MHNSQLIKALRSLNKSEFKEFGKFVNSPFHNNRREVIRFYDTIKKRFPSFESKHLTEENIFAQVYPKKKYSASLMRKLISLTMNLFQKFITELRFRNNKLEYDLELIESLRKRKLFVLHEKKLGLFNEYLNSSKQTMEIYEYQYKAANELREIDKPAGEKAKLAGFQKPLDALYAYFFSVILNEHLYIATLTQGSNIAVDLILFNEIIDYINNTGYKKHPLIYLYYLLLKLKNTEEEKYFRELLEFRKKSSAKLERVHNYNAVVILMNYCMNKIRAGFIEFRNIMFGLSQSLVDENLINANFTDPLTFVNIIQNSSAINKNEWTLMYISKYKDGLSPVLRDSLVNYAMGIVEFSRKNFGKSLQYLSSSNVKWNSMKYDVRMNILKNYYELEYFEELIPQIDAFKHYLKREKGLVRRSEQEHVLFVKYFTELTYLRIKGNYESANLLKSEVERSALFSHKRWIIEKLKALAG